VRQGGNAHPRRDHLNQQQRIVHAFKLRADACRLQEVAPDIQAATLHRINKQCLGGDIFRVIRVREASG
jgi:hypothetical protein